ncbi:MAG: SRPBCC domain-containing protein [Caulobacterales bacterium]|nr:SRPBCC domain-containing protein [Caulobacterales bacterium]
MKPSLTIVRRLKAPPSRVFAAFTRPEQIVRWWGPQDGPALEAEADLRVGGRFRMVFRTADGERQEMGGQYLEIEPDRRLVFTHQWVTLPERISQVTISLAPIPEGTELTVHHEQLHDEAVRDLHVEGWNAMLDKLPALLAAVTA